MKKTIVLAAMLTLALPANLKAQSSADCRISALYVYCAMVVAIGQSQMNKSGQTELAAKLRTRFDTTFGKFKGRTGNKGINANFVKKALDDYKANANQTLAVCIGGNNKKLQSLVLDLTQKCR